METSCIFAFCFLNLVSDEEKTCLLQNSYRGWHLHDELVALLFGLVSLRSGMLFGTLGLLLTVPTLFIIFQHLQELIGRAARKEAIQ